MQSITNFIKSQPILSFVAAAAIATCFFVPPDIQYLQYFNLKVLVILFCLMGAVAGLTRCGTIGALTNRLIRYADNTRRMSLILVFFSFFLSMLITNDVTLVTLVPITLAVFGAGHSCALIRTLVLETIAANLGGMLLPTGNPQNLYIFAHYQMQFGDFIRTIFPYWLVSLALLCIATVLQKKEPLSFSLSGETSSAAAHRRNFRPWMHVGLFAVCLLTVVDLIPYWLCLIIVCVCFICFDRKVFSGIDYTLLLTFAVFFLFVGNLARIDAVRQTAADLILGKELLAGILVSQVCSNVPAAMMLSGFTQNAGPLLVGVNLGGLGTPIASMASLITYGLYAKCSGAQKGRFLLVFSIYNFTTLLLLMLFSWMYMHI